MFAYLESKPYIPTSGSGASRSRSAKKLERYPGTLPESPEMTDAWKEYAYTEREMNGDSSQEKAKLSLNLWLDRERTVDVTPLGMKKNKDIIATDTTDSFEKYPGLPYVVIWTSVPNSFVCSPSGKFTCYSDKHSKLPQSGGEGAREPVVPYSYSGVIYTASTKSEIRLVLDKDVKVKGQTWKSNVKHTRGIVWKGSEEGQFRGLDDLRRIKGGMVADSANFSNFAFLDPVSINRKGEIGNFLTVSLLESAEDESAQVILANSDSVLQPTIVEKNETQYPTQYHKPPVLMVQTTVVNTASDCVSSVPPLGLRRTMSDDGNDRFLRTMVDHLTKRRLIIQTYQSAVTATIRKLEAMAGLTDGRWGGLEARGSYSVLDKNRWPWTSMSDFRARGPSKRNGKLGSSPNGTIYGPTTGGWDEILKPSYSGSLSNDPEDYRSPERRNSIFLKVSGLTKLFDSASSFLLIAQNFLSHFMVGSWEDYSEEDVIFEEALPFEPVVGLYKSLGAEKSGLNVRVLSERSRELESSVGPGMYEAVRNNLNESMYEIPSMDFGEERLATTEEGKGKSEEESEEEEEERGKGKEKERDKGKEKERKKVKVTKSKVLGDKATALLEKLPRYLGAIPTVNPNEDKFAISYDSRKKLAGAFPDMEIPDTSVKDALNHHRVKSKSGSSPSVISPSFDKLLSDVLTTKGSPYLLARLESIGSYANGSVSGRKSQSDRFFRTAFVYETVGSFLNCWFEALRVWSEDRGIFDMIWTHNNWPNDDEDYASADSTKSSKNARPKIDMLGLGLILESSWLAAAKLAMNLLDQTKNPIPKSGTKTSMVEDMLTYMNFDALEVIYARGDDDSAVNLVISKMFGMLSTLISIYFYVNLMILSASVGKSGDDYSITSKSSTVSLTKSILDLLRTQKVGDALRSARPSYLGAFLSEHDVYAWLLSLDGIRPFEWNAYNGPSDWNSKLRESLRRATSGNLVNDDEGGEKTRGGLELGPKRYHGGWISSVVPKNGTLVIKSCSIKKVSWKSGSSYAIPSSTKVDNTSGSSWQVGSKANLISKSKGSGTYQHTDWKPTVVNVPRAHYPLYPRAGETVKSFGTYPSSWSLGYRENTTETIKVRDGLKGADPPSLRKDTIIFLEPNEYTFMLGQSKSNAGLSANGGGPPLDYDLLSGTAMSVILDGHPLAEECKMVDGVSVLEGYENSLRKLETSHVEKLMERSEGMDPKRVLKGDPILGEITYARSVVGRALAYIDSESRSTSGALSGGYSDVYDYLKTPGSRGGGGGGGRVKTEEHFASSYALEWHSGTKYEGPKSFVSFSACRLDPYRIIDRNAIDEPPTKAEAGRPGDIEDDPELLSNVLEFNEPFSRERIYTLWLVLDSRPSDSLFLGANVLRKRTPVDITEISDLGSRIAKAIKNDRSSTETNKTIEKTVLELEEAYKGILYEGSQSSDISPGGMVQVMLGDSSFKSTLSHGPEELRPPGYLERFYKVDQRDKESIPVSFNTSDVPNSETELGPTTIDSGAFPNYCLMRICTLSVSKEKTPKIYDNNNSTKTSNGSSSESRLPKGVLPSNPIVPASFEKDLVWPSENELDVKERVEAGSNLSELTFGLVGNGGHHDGSTDIGLEALPIVKLSRSALVLNSIRNPTSTLKAHRWSPILKNFCIPSGDIKSNMTTALGKRSKSYPRQGSKGRNKQTAVGTVSKFHSGSYLVSYGSNIGLHEDAKDWLLLIPRMFKSFQSERRAKAPKYIMDVMLWDFLGDYVDPTNSNTYRYSKGNRFHRGNPWRRYLSGFSGPILSCLSKIIGDEKNPKVGEYVQHIVSVMFGTSEESKKKSDGEEKKGEEEKGKEKEKEKEEGEEEEPEITFETFPALSLSHLLAALYERESEITRGRSWNSETPSNQEELRSVSNMLVSQYPGMMTNRIQVFDFLTRATGKMGSGSGSDGPLSELLLKCTLETEVGTSLLDKRVNYCKRYLRDLKETYSYLLSDLTLTMPKRNSSYLDMYEDIIGLILGKISRGGSPNSLGFECALLYKLEVVCRNFDDGVYFVHPGGLCSGPSGLDLISRRESESSGGRNTISHAIRRSNTMKLCAMHDKKDFTKKLTACLAWEILSKFVSDISYAKGPYSDFLSEMETSGGEVASSGWKTFRSVLGKTKELFSKLRQDRLKRAADRAPETRGYFDRIYGNGEIEDPKGFEMGLRLVSLLWILEINMLAKGYEDMRFEPNAKLESKLYAGTEMQGSISNWVRTLKKIYMFDAHFTAISEGIRTGPGSDEILGILDNAGEYLSEDKFCDSIYQNCINLCEAVSSDVARVTNGMQQLKGSRSYPPNLENFLALCKGTEKAPSLAMAYSGNLSIKTADARGEESFASIDDINGRRESSSSLFQRELAALDYSKPLPLSRVKERSLDSFFGRILPRQWGSWYGISGSTRAKPLSDEDIDLLLHTYHYGSASGNVFDKEIFRLSLAAHYGNDLFCSFSNMIVGFSDKLTAIEEEKDDGEPSDLTSSSDSEIEMILFERNFYDPVGLTLGRGSLELSIWPAFVYFESFVSEERIRDMLDSMILRAQDITLPPSDRRYSRWAKVLDSLSKKRLNSRFGRDASRGPIDK